MSEDIAVLLCHKQVVKFAEFTPSILKIVIRFGATNNDNESDDEDFFERRIDGTGSCPCFVRKIR